MFSLIVIFTDAPYICIIIITLLTPKKKNVYETYSYSRTFYHRSRMYNDIICIDKINVTATGYIPVLIASTGSNRDAINAGIIPAISPIIVAENIPQKILEVERINSKSPVN